MCGVRNTCYVLLCAWISRLQQAALANLYLSGCAVLCHAAASVTYEGASEGLGEGDGLCRISSSAVGSASEMLLSQQMVMRSHALTVCAPQLERNRTPRWLATHSKSSDNSVAATAITS
jgi:hypothetical protein